MCVGSMRGWGTTWVWWVIGGGGGGEAYPSDQGVGSLGAIGGHDGAEVLMHQGPYEHYAIPVAQGHCN